MWIIVHIIQDPASCTKTKLLFGSKCTPAGASSACLHYQA
jgi:hypothetical protein